MKPLLAGIALVTAVGAQPDQRDHGSFIAFRVDDANVIAVVKTDLETPMSDAQVSKVRARFGFAYSDADQATRAAVPSTIARAADWTVHITGGQELRAKEAKLVGGAIGCGSVAGVMLTVEDADRPRLTASKDLYYVAQPAAAARTTQSTSSVGQSATPQLNDARRTQLESLLNAAMKEQLPGLREESAPWPNLDAALSRGDSRLTYDLQAFRLDRSGVPIYFVRAQWRAAGRQAFALAAWIKAGDSLSLITSDARPSGWMRMSEWRGHTMDAQNLGLVLTVLDADHDGWGEVVMAHGGYESVALDSIEFTGNGFNSPGAGFATGC